MAHSHQQFPRVPPGVRELQIVVLYNLVVSCCFFVVFFLRYCKKKTNKQKTKRLLQPRSYGTLLLGYEIRITNLKTHTVCVTSGLKERAYVETFIYSLLYRYVVFRPSGIGREGDWLLLLSERLEQAMVCWARYSEHLQCKFELIQRVLETSFENVFFSFPRANSSPLLVGQYNGTFPYFISILLFLCFVLFWFCIRGLYLRSYRWISLYKQGISLKWTPRVDLPFSNPFSWLYIKKDISLSQDA